MLLQIHFDAAYMNEMKARGTVGGLFFLGKKISPNKKIFLNDAIHIPRKVLNVEASAAKAELGSLFLNALEAVELRLALDKMVHLQPP